MIEEEDEVVMPTFEIADNPMWDGKIGEFIGNYHDKGDVVVHFSPASFYLWMTKANLTDFDIVAGPHGMLAEFEFEGKRHHISEHQVPEEFNWGEIEKAYEMLNFYESFGPLMKRLFEAMKNE